MRLISYGWAKVVVTQQHWVTRGINFIKLFPSGHTASMGSQQPSPTALTKDRQDTNAKVRPKDYRRIILVLITFQLYKIMRYY